jgi:hypothetical protein
MIESIGIFFIVLGLIFDEITTFILFTRGFSVLESNPVYTTFGMIIYLLYIIIIYVLIIYLWLYVLKTYRKVYDNRMIAWKIFDIFVFIFCMFIVMFAGIKIQAGYDNFTIMSKYFNEDTRPLVLNDLMVANRVKEQNITAYHQILNEHYYQNLTDNITYPMFWFYVVAGYLLFRVGNKVEPYGSNRDT